METTQEAIIKRSIKVLDRKIKAKEAILNANPIGELIQLRIDYQDMRKKCNDDWKSKELREFVEAAAGKEQTFKALAEKKGLLAPGVKAGEIVAWLKKDFELGHGHAMAIYATFKGKSE